MIRKILVVFLLITSSTILSQRTSSSPYSSFGIGDRKDSRTVEQTAMAGIGVAFSHYKYLNFTNPAAYADLRFTTYSFGASNNNLSIETNTASQTGNTTTLDYLALAFPFGKKAGISLGLQPFSDVGYSIDNINADGVETRFTGDGNVSKLYASFGVKLFKELSFGVEAGYFFGNINRNILENNSNDITSLGTNFEEITEIRGAGFKLGTQYKKLLKNDLVLSAGATVELENKLNVTGNDYLYSASLTLGNLRARDTLSQNSLSGDYIIPLKSTLGIGIGKFDKWYVSAEYELQNPITTSGLVSTNTSNFNYGNSNKMVLGGYYLPNINAISNYFKRITYRAGIRLEDTGILVSNNDSNNNFTAVNDFGISFGLGLPLKQMSSLNISLEYGQRGTTDNNLIKENYFNVGLSLSLTASGFQTWFRERRID
jgi:hypothetical protein